MSLAQIGRVEAGITRIATRVPGLPVTEAVILRTLTLLGRDLVAHMDHYLRPHGLSEVEFRTLSILFAHGEVPVCPSDLCSHLAQSPANMTRVADALVQAGLITRNPSEQDRRRLMLQLSDAGVALMQRLLPRMSEFMRGLFASVPATQQQRLLADLKSLVAALDTQAAAPGDAS